MNAAIERVTQEPEPLTVGADWIVVMHPPKLPRWKSRSRVMDLDSDICHFAYRTQTDDGNPSFVDWAWSVVPADGGAKVVVSWDARIKTLGRRIVAPLIRRPALRREVRASLACLRTVLEHRQTTTPELSGRTEGRTT